MERNQWRKPERHLLQRKGLFLLYCQTHLVHRYSKLNRIQGEHAAPCKAQPVLPLWSAFAEKVRIRTFWAKLVRKRSEFTLKSPNFIIFPSYNAYLTLINCPNNCTSATNSHMIIIQPCTAVCALT